MFSCDGGKGAYRWKEQQPAMQMVVRGVSLRVETLGQSTGGKGLLINNGEGATTHHQSATTVTVHRNTAVHLSMPNPPFQHVDIYHSAPLSSVNVNDVESSWIVNESFFEKNELDLPSFHASILASPPTVSYSKRRKGHVRSLRCCSTIPGRV